jgi:hypothetical protein
MAVFRVPYPVEPERRHDLFHRLVPLLARHGSYQGTPEQGTFHGTTPIGAFAGSYFAIEGSAELEIRLTKKPFWLSTHRLEHEVRKLLAANA